MSSCQGHPFGGILSSCKSPWFLQTLSAQWWIWGLELFLAWPSHPAEFLRLISWILPALDLVRLPMWWDQSRKCAIGGWSAGLWGRWSREIGLPRGSKGAWTCDLGSWVRERWLFHQQALHLSHYPCISSASLSLTTSVIEIVYRIRDSGHRFAVWRTDPVDHLDTGLSSTSSSAWRYRRLGRATWSWRLVSQELSTAWPSASGSVAMRFTSSSRERRTAGPSIAWYTPLFSGFADAWAGSAVDSASDFSWSLSGRRLSGCHFWAENWVVSVSQEC